ncbi:spore coat protein U domain-containing protein [Sphingomonas sp. AP4-R1]|uniref:spore coat protein U domain-containing protein n=1 Tax=Sphingomonas sp. AP4-R1 TaxID=2735134 RepID=UPI001493667E|nr:spore coat protein U domain-containing protein [Sphingomonas sp. AP4-R1]QJU56996.1 spore coat protein U domain-containing protein [Sphingomonas sp. AP4-R1]
MNSIAAFAALAGMGIAVPTGSFVATAASSTGQLDVRLEVVPGCGFSSSAGGIPASAPATDILLDFGRIGSDEMTGGDTTAIAGGDETALSVSCSTSYTGSGAPMLTVDGGAHASGAQRHLAGPNGITIAYELFQDRARTIPYTPGAATQLVIPTAGAASPVAIFGRIAGVTGLPDGLYTDTVTLMLSY